MNWNHIVPVQYTHARVCAWGLLGGGGDETMENRMENRMCFGELAHAPPGCACTCAFQMYLSADLLF